MSEGGKRHVGTKERKNLAIPVFAGSCTEKDRTGESGPSADRMDDSRSGEVKKPELAVQKSPTPLPGRLNRVDEAGQDCGEEKNGQIFILSASAPDTIDAVAAQNINWKK